MVLVVCHIGQILEILLAQFFWFRNHRLGVLGVLLLALYWLGFQMA